MKGVKEHWTEVIVGAFVLISPWLLGFSDITLARWGNVVCGLTLILVGIWAIYGRVPVLYSKDCVGTTKKSKNNKNRETV
jgi:hypothetical protein